MLWALTIAYIHFSLSKGAKKTFPVKVHFVGTATIYTTEDIDPEHFK